MSTVTLHHGDSRDVLRAMIARGERVHSVVCDPPYHLESIVKRFGKAGSAPAKHGTDGAFARQSRGFMGKTWDGADADGSRIAQDPEFWSLVWEVLLPGGFIIAFSSSRTYGPMQVAMELAGFVTHPMIGWIQGQGFPKAHNASKAIDQQLGTVGSPEAAAWEGWAYGLQTLKPSLEPIYVGQKPFSEKNGALNLLKHGVGVMNIDGCRVPANGESLGGGDTSVASVGKKGHEGWERPWMFDEAAKMCHAAKVSANVEKAETLGRHPANVIHDGSDEVVACFPDSAGQQASVKGNEPSGVTNGIYGEFAGRVSAAARNDSGSAARFFNALPFTEGDEPPFIYHPKATKADRVVGCTVCGVRALRDPGCDCRDPEDPSKAAKRQAHPTVKPVSLMRWLQRLVTPAGGTTLDPFAGSGTSGSAALAEGFNVVLIEREDDYVADIRARLNMTPPAAIPLDILDLLGHPPVVDRDLISLLG